MTLVIEEELDITFNFDYKEIAKKVCQAVLDEEAFPYECEISLTLTTEDAIHEMNQQFRDIDRSTDVLSFPMIDYPGPGDFSHLTDESDIFDFDTGEAMLGDIVLSIPRVISQADEYGHSIKREYAFLIAHSMLHLLGYDHMEENERIQMENKQRLILDKIGITRNEEE